MVNSSSHQAFSNCHVLAYVGVEKTGKSSDFLVAKNYLDLFLFIYTLNTGLPYLIFRGVGIPISDYS